MKADSKNVTRLLKTAKGQLEGILRMVEEDRYCIDISNQILAVQAILNKVNHEVLSEHVRHCVHDAAVSGNGEEKVEEVLNVLDKMIR